MNKDARVQGAPLDLHEDSGMAAISKAGLLEAFKANFLPGADRLKIANEHGNVFFSDHDRKVEQNFGNRYFRPEIDRGALRRILLESLQPETVLWNRHFVGMDKMNRGWRLRFKDQEAVYADLVIAADGANSKIRPYLTDEKPFYSGVTMLEGNIYDAKNTAPRMAELLNGGKVMAFGNKKNLLMGQKGNGEIGFYASFKTGENWAVESGLNFSDKGDVLSWFKKEYFEWNAFWYELFEKATTPFIPRPIYCAPLDQHWEAQSNVTMLGDAAHVMPPFAGEGVNMAMLDALELSEFLTVNQSDNLQQCIDQFETGMRKRAATVAQESLDNGEQMHSEKALQTMLDFFTSH